MPRRDAIKLPFKDLNTKVGPDELIKRLKACLKYVEECETLDDTVGSELLSLTSTLISRPILSHKQREVPLLSACILICIIKLFSEDTLPFGDEQTKTIYSLFVSQLNVLENPSSSIFNFSFKLLENLSTLKMFTYALDIEATEIITELFDTIVSVVNGKQSSLVHSLLLNILVDIIQESKIDLPMDAFNIIMPCIIEPQKSANPVAYEFVSQLIKKTSLNLEHYVHIFFTMSMSDESSPSTALAVHLYDIIHSLHEIDSSVLLSVLPRLETILQSTNEVERLKVTKMLAKMFGYKNSKLAVENRLLWQSFLGRFQDISSDIRCECVKMSKYFLVYHHNIRDDVSEKLVQRLLDSDEKVRLAVVKTIAEIAMEDITALQDLVFCALRDRMRDRKSCVRKETIQSLCRVYRHFMSQDSLSLVELDMIKWIPNKLFHCLFQRIREDSVNITRALLSCIIPVSLDPVKKMERLLDVFNSLDDNAIRAFEDFMKQRKKLRKLIQDLVAIHNDSNLKGGEQKKLLLAKSIAINVLLPEPFKSLSHVKDLVSSLPDVSELLLKCVDVTNNYSTLTQAKSDILTNFSSNSLTSETVKSILDMSSPMLVDRECTHHLVERVTRELCDPSLGDSEDMEEKEQMKCKNGLRLIKILCLLEPSWFKQENTLTDMLAVLRHKDQEIVENSMLTLSNIGKGVSEWTTVSGSLQPILISLVTKGSPRVAKLSVKCLHSVYSKTDMVIDQLLKNLLRDLAVTSSKLRTTLSSLSQIARFYPLKFCSKHQTIVQDFVVPKIILAKNKPVKGKNSNLWCDEEDLQHDVKLKIACLKLLISWMIGLHNAKMKEEKEEQMENILLDLLTETLESGGNMNYDKTTSASSMSHMRLAVGTGILKLVRLAGCMQNFTIYHHQLLLRLTNDPCDEVREIFITKLYDGLRLFTLPLSYLSLFCKASDSTVPDTLPKPKLKEMLSIVIKLHREYYESLKRKTNSPDSYKTAQLLPEYSLPYAVYLLSHDESFSRTQSNRLDVFRDHLWFFLEPFVCKTDNYGFIQKMMESIKQTVCTENPKDDNMNKNVYTVCDLTMALLNHKKSVVSWGEFQGQVILPKKLYTMVKKKKPNATKYLPKEYTLYSSDKGGKTTSDSPVKKRRQQKVKRDDTMELSDISDIDEATPTKKVHVSPCKATTPNEPTSSRKKRSPKKQTKIPFMPKNQQPVTSTPAVVRKPDRKGKERNAKRKVLQEDNGKSIALRRSPRKRNTLNSVCHIEESNKLTDITEEEQKTDDDSDQDDKMEVEIEEKEEEQQQEEEIERGPSPPPAKQLKRDDSPTTEIPLTQEDIKIKRRVTRRRR